MQTKHHVRPSNSIIRLVVRGVISFLFIACLPFANAQELPGTTFEAPTVQAQEYSVNDTIIEPSPLPPIPQASSVDEVNVNVISGLPIVKHQGLTIGNGYNQLQHNLTSYDGKFWGLRDDYSIGIVPMPQSPGYLQVYLGHQSQVFLQESWGYTAANHNGATLIENSDGSYLYTNKDGTTLNTQNNTITYANGFEIQYHIGNEQTYTNSLGHTAIRKRRQSVPLGHLFSLQQSQMHNTVSQVNSYTEFLYSGDQLCCLNLTKTLHAYLVAPKFAPIQSL